MSPPPSDPVAAPASEASPDERAAPPMGGALGRRLILVTLAGVVLYGVLVVVRGADSIRAELAHFHWSAFVLACALSFVNYGLRFAKWEYYLYVLRIHTPKRALSYGESFLVFLSGFVLTVTPGKVGEVFKSLVLREFKGIDMVRTAPIIVAERLTDVVGVVLLIAFGSTALPGGLVWATAGTLAVLGLLAFVGIPGLSAGVFALARRIPGRAGSIAARSIPKAEAMLLELRSLTSPRHLVLPSVLSVVGWALEGIGIWILLGGFGVRAPLAPVAFSYATATLAGALIPVPGGLGVTEKVLEETMVAVGGVPGPIATATMLLGRLATLWFAVVVGFVALAVLRARNPGLLAAPKPTPTD
jgi:uncharacterized membrane protein YbhN (UPF0104 family)